MVRPRLDGFDYQGRHSYFLTFCTYRSAAGPPRRIDRINGRPANPARAARAQLFRTFGYLPLASSSERNKVAGKSMPSAPRQPLWQDSYYDHVVRPEENLTGIGRYIIENPVRAGLVESALEYPFVGSTEWSIEELLSKDR